MNATQIATVFLDRGMRLTRHTPAAAPLFNLTAASIGHPVPHSGHRLDYPEMEADAAQVLDTLVPVEREIRCGDRWLLVRVLPYRTMEDSIAGTVLSFVDFTARRNAEEALRASEEKYHTLFDSMDEGYCIVRMIYDGEGKAVDWRFLEVNRAFERNNGLHSAEGRTIRALVPGIEAKWMEILDRVARTGEPRRLEEESPAMGRVFSLYAFRIGGAHERRVAIIFTDVTGRKRAETGLRRSEEMFSSLVGNAPFGIYLVDSHFRLRTANAVTRGVFQGIDPLLGRDFGEIVRILWREPFASAVIARFDHTLKTGEPWISPPMMEPRANVDENQSYDWQIHRVTLPDGTWGVVCYFYKLSELRKPQPAGNPPGNPRRNTL